MRGADNVPGARLPALPAFWVGLLYDPASLDGAWELARHWSAAERQALRDDVPRLALGARIGNRSVAEIARDCLALAEAGLRRRARHDHAGRDESCHLAPLARTLETGRTPAEDMLEKFHGVWGGSVERAYADYAL
jgi:glutamate--cysteine ligase